MPPVKRPTPDQALTAALPALSRLLEAAAQWLEGVNESRLKIEAQAAENQATMDQLAASPDHGRERESDVTTRPFNCQSLNGSWFHKLDADGKVELQGSIIADVAPPGQPGIYLVELHQWMDGRSAYQTLIPLRAMTEPEDGGSWRFYDDDQWMRMAHLDRKALAVDNVNRQEVT